MSKMISNPNDKIVEAIRGRLKATNGQCPCLPETKWNEDIKCPCKKFREENVCCCNLYVVQEEEE